MEKWFTLSSDDTLDRLETDANTGLSSEEAQRRREEYGENKLVTTGGRSPWTILLAQFKETMVLILLAAGLVSWAIGDVKDTVVIMAIVVLNAALGFFQEYRAEQAMEALKKMAVPHVNVVRDGEEQDIEATNLVPGDIILLEAGAAVPADARLVQSSSLRLEEAALTGESVPVDKTADAVVGEEAELGDRPNMVYMGTAITYGRGKAVVVETGMDTQLGEIATMIQSVEEEDTPLQRRMDQLGKRLALVSVALVSLVFALGVWRGGGVTEMLLTAITLAVAAVPEGLPAVVTIALALGARRMVAQNALIRRLPAVETLGSVTTICSDKTGTLTENRMTVTVLDVAGRTIELSTQRKETFPDEPPEETFATLELLLIGGMLSNDAKLRQDTEDPKSYYTVGDPTEGALVMAAAHYGFRKDELEKELPRIEEVPFSSERKRMTTIHEVPANHEHLPILQSPYVAFSKGAVDSLLGICSHIWTDGKAEPLTDEWVSRITKSNDEMASDGTRVLGIAFRSLDEIPEKTTDETMEHDLIFVGMMGMIDPPRREAGTAVKTAHAAGIRTIMITGDHQLTAKAIARDLDIQQGADREALTGRDLSQMSEPDLERVVDDVSVYARVSPEHKLKIVTALQNKGQIAAMTGDGVNDAPALKKADIGVSMGETGTDVAKEASDMILLDDNFATIVAAVKEGRTIYDNIRKFIKYLLTSNSGEIWTMLFAPIVGLPVPLLPLQILWINLVTDGLPALALGVEPPEPDVMDRPPYPPNESVFARGLWQHIIWVGLFMGLLTFGVQYFTVGTVDTWQTMVFNTLAIAQMAHVLAIRSERQSLFQQGIFSNIYMVLAVLSTLVLQLVVIYVPFFQFIFETKPLSVTEFAITIVVASAVFIVVEIEKWLKRHGMSLY